MMTRFRSTPAWRLALIAVFLVSVTTLARTPIGSATKWVAETPPARAVGAAVRATGRTVLPERTRRVLKRAMGSPSPSPMPTITATKAAVIQNDVDADGRADPGDTIRYTVTIANAGVSPADDATGVQVSDIIDAHTTLVGGSIVVSPLATGETYMSIGNMTLTSSSLGGNCAANARRSVICNDLPASVTVVGFGATQATANGTVVNGTNTVTTSNNGTALLNSDGTFVFNPAAGFEGTDSFWYTVSNTAGTDNAQVSITVGGANGMVWFVNSTGAAGTGRQSSPFNSLSAFNTVNTGTGTNPAAGDTVILLENATAYTGPVTLLNNQIFIGQDATVAVTALGGPALPSNGSGGTPTAGNASPATHPTGTTVNITSASTALTLGTGNTIAGFTVGNSTTAISGGAAGTVKVRDVLINTNGAGLVISTSAAITNDATFTGFTSITASGGTNGVSLTDRKSVV